MGSRRWTSSIRPFKRKRVRAIPHTPNDVKSTTRGDDQERRLGSATGSKDRSIARGMTHSKRRLSGNAWSVRQGVHRLSVMSLYRM